MSVFPPATNGTMMVTGRAGHSSACDTPADIAQNESAMAASDPSRLVRAAIARGRAPAVEAFEFVVHRSEKWCIGRISTS
jgi:hypothetical protein